MGFYFVLFFSILCLHNVCAKGFIEPTDETDEEEIKRQDAWEGKRFNPGQVNTKPPRVPETIKDLDKPDRRLAPPPLFSQGPARTLKDEHASLPPEKEEPEDDKELDEPEEDPEEQLKEPKHNGLQPQEKEPEETDEELKSAKNNNVVEPNKDKRKNCTLPKKAGECRAYIPRYYYNTKSKKCEEFIYGGCNGNGNNFMTKEDCEKNCSENSDNSSNST